MKREFSLHQQIAICLGIAVGGWVGFLFLFQKYFPYDYDPQSSRGILWVWLGVGTFSTTVLLLAVFWFMRTPPQWRSSCAIAGFAPALSLDAIATTFYRDWFPSAGQFEVTAYPAVVLGGAGVTLLVGMYSSIKKT